jgi:hypothetical protein
MNVHIDDQDRAAYNEMNKRFEARVEATPTITQLTRKILAGEAHLNDHPHLLLLEDAITQAGQGQIVDRKNGMFWRTDVGVLEMRKVFEREMKAVAENKPVKN